MSEEKEFVNLCLIAKPGSNMPNCHENDFCYCDIEKLKKENNKLKKALGFYADTNNWILPQGEIYIVSQINLKDVERILDLDGDCGGKLARQTLKGITVFKKNT